MTIWEKLILKVNQLSTDVRYEELSKLLMAHGYEERSSGTGGTGMKKMEYYMSLNYKMEIRRDEDGNGYIISFPDLKGCLTCCDHWQEILPQAEEAKREWLHAALEGGYPIPEPQQFSGQFKLRIPKNLHRELAEEARREGISMNQYCLYLLSKNFRHGAF